MQNLGCYTVEHAICNKMGIIVAQVTGQNMWNIYHSLRSKL
jgi:hypothetical protein